MSHEIAEKADGSAAALFSILEGAGWTGLGRPIPLERAKDTEWIAKEAGLDFDVVKKPCFFQDNDGNYIAAPNRDILVRSDNAKPLSVVSKSRYHVENRQPRDTVYAYQELLDKNQLDISHVAALRGGADIVVSARLPSEYDINVGKKALKDSIATFLTLMTGYNGHGTTAYLSYIRAVCANTLAAGMQDAKETGRTKTIKASTKLEEGSLSELLEKVKGMVEVKKRQFDAMANTAMSNEEVARYFADVLEVNIKDLGKVDKNGKKLVSGKTENIITAMTNSYSNAPGAAIATGSVWGAFNAVTYYGTHLKTTRDTYGDGKAAAMVASNLNGDAARLKMRALQLAAKYAQIKVAA